MQIEWAGIGLPRSFNSEAGTPVVGVDSLAAEVGTLVGVGTLVVEVDSPVVAVGSPVVGACIEEGVRAAGVLAGA